MGLLDRILGLVPSEQQRQGQGAPSGSVPAPPRPGASEDERAVARYRYLLRTAPPEQLEAMHAEAFSRLTPEQRQQLLTELGRDVPAGEQPASAEPADLARAATRAEMRAPGTLQTTFSRGSFAGGAGGMFMGSMMGTVAGVVVGSMVADSLLGGFGDSPESQEVSGGDGSGDPGGDAGSADAGGADAGGFDSAGGDAGGGWDLGGGGDFGGGDFGGF